MFERTRTLMGSDTAFQLTSSDIKSGIMAAKGTFYVPMPRYISPVNCQLEIRVSRDTVEYRFYDFYLVAIDYPLETVIEKNKDASREKTKQFMWFLTAGLHAQVVSWSQAFDANFADWKR